VSSAADRVQAALAGRGALVFSLAVLGLFLYLAYEIQAGFSTRSRLFATTLVVPAILLAGAQAVREARRLGVPMPVPPEAAFRRSALVWAAAFFVSLWVLGLIVTVPLFAFVYLRLAAGEGWPKAAAYAVATWLFIELVFIRLLHVPLPGGVMPLPGITQ
jgi:hypothetical protein